MKPTSKWKLELRSINRCLLSANVLALLISCGGGSSAPGVGIQNVTASAPRLQDVNAAGDYTPYYATGEMQRPRYFHKAILDQKGRPIIFGGTDERGYSGLDTMEIFDQANFEEDVPRPASGTGVWIDTDFEGNPMVFQNGPRLRFTIDQLSDGRILIVGGGPDLLRSRLYDQAEVFDPETRVTTQIEDAKMVVPRFSHTSVLLGDGSFLFIGGQIAAQVTIIDDRIPEGQPGRERQEIRYVTTPLCEIFSPKENKFLQLNFADTTRASTLNTPRGRADHTVTKLAGADGKLKTSDDVVLVAAGFQSFSGQFAPDNKFAYNVARQRAVGLQGIEFFDPLTLTFTQVSNVSLDSPKMNGVHLLNFGTYNDLAIDGSLGVGNMAFLTGGNVDTVCPDTLFNDLLLVATYTGFGPAGGIQFFRIVEELNLSFVEGNEGFNLLPPVFPVARCATDAIPLPRALQTAPRAGNLATWFFTSAGVDITTTPNGCAYDYASPNMLAGSVFDPYFSLPATDLGQSARDLRTLRTISNPFGIIGCWLTLDGALPTIDRSLYATTPPARWARRVGASRVWCDFIQAAGEDGIIDSTDDRVLMTGGGTDYGDPINVGGEPTTPSAELMIMPGSLTKRPSP